MINNLTESDNGTYICQAESKSGAKSPEARETIKIVGSEDIYIGSFNFHGTHVIIQPKGENETRWYFTVEARPMSHAKFIWKGPRGDFIDDRNLEKYEKNIDGDKVKLVIKDVTIDDMGPYPFEVSVKTANNSETANETLVLIVNEEPSVGISFDKNPALPFYKIGKEYSISCDVKGYPIDTDSLEFYFYPCDNYAICYPNQKQLFNATLQPIDGVTDPKYHFHFSSDTKFTASVSGKVGCDICNENNPNCVKKEENMFVNENENGFEITGAEREVEIVEGDDINLKCEASKYKYSKITWLFGGKKRVGTKHQFGQRNKSEVSSTTQDSKHSLIQTLSFKSISKKKEGKYSCEAIKVENGLKDRLSRALYIYDVEEPTLRTTNLNVSTINVLAEEEFTFICDVTGRPEPDILWFKDGQRVNETNFIEDRGKTLKLKYVRGKDSGKYSCVAENRGGRMELSVIFSVADDPEFNLAALIGGSSAAGVILMIVILIMLWKIREYNAKIRTLTAAELQLFEHGDPSSINEQLDVHEQTDLLPYDK